ncbi:MAG: right-handed parallel beta-helix repeat-containing protein [Verrucomicrobiota bacterium]
MKITTINRIATLGLATLMPAILLGQGSLTPPPHASLPANEEALDALGAPKISMKTLAQTDPGQPIPSRDPAMVDLNGSGPEFLIKEPGHYYLTENLVGDRPIVIDSDGVTLDLRGFEIRFAPSGGAGGIAITSDIGGMTHDRITVKNGKIIGGWVEGIRLGGRSSVKDVEVSGPLTFGIYVGGTSLVEDCQVMGPGEPGEGPGPHAGIFAGDCSVITGCTANNVHGKGIETGNGSTIVDCTTCGNLGCGIVGLKGNTVKNSTALRNGSTGIDFYAGNTIANCNAAENGAEGFLVRSGTNLQNCVSRCNVLEGYAAVAASAENGENQNNAVNFLQCSATENRADGFRSDINTLFTHCTADSNGVPGDIGDPDGPDGPGGPGSGAAVGDGFDISEGSRMFNCVSTNNAVNGVTGARFNSVADSTIHSNGNYGLELGTTENVVVRNYIRGNGTGGINLAGGSIAPFVLPSASANALGNYSF